MDKHGLLAPHCDVGNGVHAALLGARLLIWIVVPSHVTTHGNVVHEAGKDDLSNNRLLQLRGRRHAWIHGNVNPWAVHLHEVGELPTQLADLAHSLWAHVVLGTDRIGAASVLKGPNNSQPLEDIAGGV
ncbi:hypothetical protein GGI16_009624 [Coemansia sp. S142-1]|nr:hypothetical protein GGI16_009624 [Coemansia sp. S142-1]